MVGAEINRVRVVMSELKDQGGEEMPSEKRAGKRRFLSWRWCSQWRMVCLKVSGVA